MAARPGDTIAIVVDGTNADYDSIENHDLSPDNVEIRIADIADQTCNQLLPVRSVFDASGSATSVLAASFVGARITVAVVDLPSDVLPCNTSYPVDALVTLVKNGVDSFYVKGSLLLIDGVGAPAVFDHAGQDASVELVAQPALRLRPQHDDGQPGFDPGETYAAIEFDLGLPASGCAADPVVRPAADLAGATTLAGTAGPEGVRVLALAPEGFSMPLPSTPALGVTAEGPILEIALTKTCAFGIADFSIENLVVTRLDGTIAVDLRDAPSPDGSSDYFKRYAVSNN